MGLQAIFPGVIDFKRRSLELNLSRSKHDEFTVVIRRPIAKGSSRSVEDRISDLLVFTEEFPDHLSGVVLRSGNVRKPELVLVLRFVDKAAWTQWRHHPVTEEKIAAIENETGVKGELHFAEGLAGWFDLPGVTGFKAPSKIKMAIATWLTIFPLLVLVISALKPFTTAVDPVIKLGITAAITVPIMTWIAMPLTTRVLRFWLYKERE